MNAGTAAVETAELVRRARCRDRDAWERLVDRYARLVWSVTRDYRVSESDASDVAQTTWLRLLEHMDNIDPAKVGAWLTTTARRECLRVIALRTRTLLAYDEDGLAEVPGEEPTAYDLLLTDERAKDVRQAFRRLPDRWQQLLRLSMSSPPVPYAEISRILDLPIGSIGPMRGRCLARLRTLMECA